MAKTLRVLLIEDEPSNIVLWNETAEAHNADADTYGFSVETIVAKSVTEAEAKLASCRIDAAVVDLRLNGPDAAIGPNDDGNLLVKKMIETLPIGIVVFTGQRSEVADFDCPQVQVIDRADGVHAVFAWLKEHARLLVTLRCMKDTLDAETARLFFKSIWPRWSQWAAETAGDTPLERIVARHAIAHVHDSMLHDGDERVHPEETYFVPCLKPRLDTGDLLELDGSVWVVVTPRCDMARDGKVSTVVLAKCEDMHDDWDRWAAANSKTANDKMAKMSQHDHQPKQHFLAQLSDQNGLKRGPWLVQFHDLRVLPAKQAFADLPSTRIASLAPQFVPALTERFGGFFSRVGTPDLSSD